MSKSINFWSIAISLLTLNSGCQKESVREPDFSVQSLQAGINRPIKITSKTWYRIRPTIPAPLTGMEGQLSFANIPGGGSGTISHMGNVGIWFNQLAFSPNGLNPPAGTIAAPLVEAVDYAIEFPGAPLPLIQPNDFAGLRRIIAWLQIPATANGHIINTIVHNVKGDALFLSATTPSITMAESATRINFSGDGIFVGGRGKFEQATGTYHFTGFFNPQDANDAGFSIDGTFSY